MSDTDAEGTELWFLQVPAPQSGHVVAHLKLSARVAMAAAVYSGVDVVAIVDGSQSAIDAAFVELESADTPMASLERFPADEIVPGLSYGSHQALLRSSCTAFIRCAIRVPEVSVSFATSVMSQLPGVTRLFPNSERKEVVLEAVAVDKRVFDDTVMSTIQGQWSVVKSTRTFLVINHLQWHRDADASPAGVFVSAAASDLPFATALSDRIKADTGLAAWAFPSIPIGAPSWTSSVDDVMAAAPLHIFVLSKASLASSECQREFGRVEVLAESRDICCLVLADCEFAQLPTRYQQRQCLDATSFFAYAQLLEWMRVRLQDAEA